MHFYAMGYEELMDIPVRAFWFMNASIDRISAQKDVRSLSVAMSSQGGEGAMQHRERLVLEIGTVVTITDDPMSQVNCGRDEVGFAELKAMGNEKVGD